MPDKAKWKLIYFKKGRQEKLFVDPKKGLLAAKKLNERGIKAHLVSRVKPFWPAEDDNMKLLAEGMLWCPYCRRWRWFKKQSKFPDPKSGKTWVLPERFCCAWCTISVKDFYVVQMNGDYAIALDAKTRKRKGRRRKRPV